MYKVCITGCGMIAESAHIPAYRQFPDDYFIAAVCDIKEEYARDFAKRNGIPAYYTSLSEMLEAEKPDVLSVCVPNSFHKEHTMLALAAGVNVLCEKPLTISYRDACEMFEAAKKNGKVLMCCQSMRFTSDRLAAKKYIDENGLGEIYYAEFSRVRRRGIPYWGSFHKKAINLGGAMCDIGVHMIDAVVWLCGKIGIRSVCGSMGQNHKHELGSALSSGDPLGLTKNKKPFDPNEMDVEDFASGMIKLENGGNINFKVAWAANTTECTEIRICGRDAGIRLPEGTVYRGTDEDIPLMAEDEKYSSPFPGHIHIADNLRKVLSGTESPIIREDETKTVAAILEMFYLSAAENREVTFREISKK